MDRTENPGQIPEAFLCRAIRESGSGISFQGADNAQPLQTLTGGSIRGTASRTEQPTDRNSGKTRNGCGCLGNVREITLTQGLISDYPEERKNQHQCDQVPQYVHSLLMNLSSRNQLGSARFLAVPGPIPDSVV